MNTRSVRSAKNAQTQTLTGKLQDDAKNRDTVFYLIIYHHPVMQRPAIYANALQTSQVIDVSYAKGGDILRPCPRRSTWPGQPTGTGNGIGRSPLSSFVNTAAACSRGPDGLSAQQAPYHVPPTSAAAQSRCTGG